MIILNNRDGSRVISNGAGNGASVFADLPTDLDLTPERMRQLDQIRLQWQRAEASFETVETYESITLETLLVEARRHMGRNRGYADVAVSFAAVMDGRPWNLVQARFIKGDLRVPAWSGEGEDDLLMAGKAWAVGHRLGLVPHVCYLRIYDDGAVTVMAPGTRLRSFEPMLVLNWAASALREAPAAAD